MKDASYQISKAIYDRLNGNISYTVVNGIPQDNTYPIVSYHIVSADNFGSKSLSGQVIVVQFDCWSAPNGSDKEVYDMFDEILQELTTTSDGVGNDNVLTTTNFDVNQQMFRQSSIIQDIDDRTRHGILQVEFWISEK